MAYDYAKQRFQKFVEEREEEERREKAVSRARREYAIREAGDQQKRTAVNNPTSPFMAGISSPNSSILGLGNYPTTSQVFGKIESAKQSSVAGRFSALSQIMDSQAKSYGTTQRDSSDAARSAEDAFYSFKPSEAWPAETPLPTSTLWSSYALGYDNLPASRKTAETDQAVKLYREMQSAYDTMDNASYLAPRYEDYSTMYKDMAEIESMPMDVREAFSVYAENSDKVYSANSNLDMADVQAGNAAAETVYRYLTAQYGSASTAQQKMEELKSSYTRYQNEQRAEATSQYAEDEVRGGFGSGLWANTKAIAASLGGGITGGMEATTNYLQSLFGQGQDERYNIQDANLPGFDLSRYAGAVQTATGNVIEENVPGFAGYMLGLGYSAAFSAAENLARIYALGPGGSLATAAYSQFGQGYQDALSRGASPNAAALYGAITGGLEVATEKLSVDRLIKTNSPKNILDVLENAAKQGWIELTEEEISYLGGLLADTIVLQDKSQYNTNVGLYMDQGYSENEAREKAAKEILLEALETISTSFLSGAEMSGVHQGTQYLGTMQTGANLNQAERQVLLDAAAEMPGTEAYRTAMDGGIDQGAAYFGRLYQQVNQALRGEENGAASGQRYEAARAIFEEYRQEQQNRQHQAEASMEDSGTEGAAPAKATTETWVDLILRRKNASQGTIQRILTNRAQRTEFREKTGVTVPEIRLTGRNASSQEEINAASDLVRQTISDWDPSSVRPASSESQPVVTAIPGQAIQAKTADGRSIAVSGVTFDENGELLAQTDAGNIPVTDLEFSNSDMATVVNIAAGYSENVARNFLANYSGDLTPMEYWNAYNAFLSAGRLGAADSAFTFERAAAVNGVYAAMLPENVQQQAYTAGLEEAQAQEQAVKITQRKAAPGEGKVTDRTEAETEGKDAFIEVLRKYGEKTGLNVEYLKEIPAGEAKANGKFVAQTMSMYLSEDAGNVLQALGHESGEFISAFAPEEKAELRHDILSWWAYHENLNSIDALARRVMNAYLQAGGRKTYNQAIDEIVNDAIGALLTTEQGQTSFLQWLETSPEMTKREKTTLVARLKSAIQKILDGIKRYLRGKSVGKETRRFLEMEADEQQKIMTKFFRAMDKAIANASETGQYFSEDASYSLNWDEDLSDFAEEEPRRDGTLEEQWAEDYAAGAQIRDDYRAIEAAANDAMRTARQVANRISAETERAAARESLQKLNIATQNLVAYWKRQTKPSRGKSFTEAINQKAKGFVQNTTMRQEEMAVGLQEIYNALHTDNYAKAMEAAEHYAGRMLEESYVRPDQEETLYNQYEAARKYFRNATILISQTDAQGITDFNALRKANFGRVKIAVTDNPDRATINRDYSEYVEMLPGLLSPDVLNPTDQLLEVLGALDRVYADKDGPEPRQIEYGNEDVKFCAMQMIEAVTDLSFTPDTIADRQIANQAEQTKAEVEAARREAAEEEASAWRTKLQELRDTVRQEQQEARADIRDLQEALEKATERHDSIVQGLTKDLLQLRRASERNQRRTGRVQEDLANAKKEIRRLKRKVDASTKALQAADNSALAEAMYVGRKRGQEVNRLRKQLSEEKDKRLRLNERMLKRLETADRKLKTATDRFSQYKKNQAEWEETMRYRASVLQKSRSLMQMLVENSNKRHVPEVLKKPVAQFLQSIDFSSASSRGTRTNAWYSNQLSRVRDILNKQISYQEEQAGGEEMIQGYLDLPAGFFAALDYHVSSIRESGNQVYEMDAEQLQQLDVILDILHGAVRNINRLFTVSRYKTTQAAAESTMRYASAMKQDSGRARRTRQFFQWDNATPITVFNRFGDGGKAIFQSIQDGWDKMAFNTKSVIDFANKAYSDREVREWSDTVQEITLEDGEVIQMTTAQMMSLYCLSKRRQAIQHLLGGGMRISNIPRSGRRKGIVQAENILLTEEDIAAISGRLTKRQRTVADNLQRYMTRQGAEWGNAVTMERFGYRAFTEDIYFPITSDPNTLNVRDPDGRNSGLFRLLNMSFTRTLNERANNAVVVSNIFDVFSSHMTDMAKYNALALPLLDAMKWYNYKEVAQLESGQHRTKTVKTSLEEAYGKSAEKYFIQFMKDMNGMNDGGTPETESFPRRMLSNYKRAAVGANLRVALLQFTSYPRAMFVLPARYLAAVPTRQGYREMMRYSGIAVWKELGFYDTGIGRNVRQLIKRDQSRTSKLTDKAMYLASRADQITWTALWNASKQEVKKTRGLSGDKLMEATAKRFREVVYKTQVVDSTVTRSQGMRSKTTFGAMANAFMSEPTIAYNLLLDAWASYNADYRRTGKRGRAFVANKSLLLKGLSAYSITALVSAIAETITDAFRDDDEYEDFVDKLLQAAGGNLADNMLPFGNLPILSDAVSLLQGYDVERLDTAFLGSLIEVFRIWAETYQLETGQIDSATQTTYYGRMTTYGKIYKTLQAISQTTGLPLANLTRDAVDIYNNTIGVVTGQKIKRYDSGAEYSIKTKYQEGYLSADKAMAELQRRVTDEDGNPISADDVYWMVKSWETGESSKTYTLTQALIDGAPEAIQAAKDELLSHGYTEDDMSGMFARAIGEAYTEDANGNVGSGRITREQAEEYLQQYGEKEPYEIFAKLQEWDYKLENGSTEGFSVYSGLHVAIDNGDSTDGAESALLAGGYSEDQIKSAKRSYIRKLYQNAEISESEARALLTQYLGITEEKDLYAAIQGWNDIDVYGEVEAAVAAGESISAPTRALVENGYLESEVRSHAVSHLRDLYMEGEISDQQAIERFMAYSNPYSNGDMPDENDAFWAIDEWKFDMSNDDPEAKYQKYSQFYETIDSGGDLSQTIRYYTGHGVSTSTLASQITKQYKDEYIRLYYSDTSASVELKRRLLAAYVALGYDYTAKNRDINDWISQYEKEQANKR